MSGEIANAAAIVGICSGLMAIAQGVENGVRIGRTRRMAALKASHLPGICGR
jgi:hypothetical protein